ncbi:hypothetical protein R3I93_013929 [Phoxinus phoxinus]|uniref:Ig-like domain-containing protein n=1 Tax=Phoxinus phoxinus TaxID=58324 RepID=A0AAN9CW29_9TELE
MSLLKLFSFHLIFTLSAFTLAESANEYYSRRWSRCIYSSPDLSDMDVTLLDSVKPKVKLSSVTRAGGRHPAVLMCSAYAFYPLHIKVSWLRDGKEVTSDVTSTMEMADGDWYYQIHSELEYTPKSGEKISCMVEHASFNKPMIYDWDPSLPESERNKIAIGSSGLVLGIVLAAAGLIYYKKKSSDYHTDCMQVD